MARRKGWNDLSVPVRKRYERAGITRSAYESGASLSSARGHTVGRTPERPETADKNPEQFREYLRRRGKLMHVISTRGGVDVIGMGRADRSTVGSHANYVKSYSTNRNAAGLLKNHKVKLESFRGVTVTGYRSRDKNAPLETFELEWNPKKLNAQNHQGQLQFKDIYAETGSSLAGAA